MSDARTVKPGEMVRYHNEPRQLARGLADTARLRAALEEALDLAERFAVQVEEETYFADGGSETKRRIAELRKEFGV